ncbi:hypothetical protein TNCV_309101 [Trichonephila clavipes]|nr:hypothetical protein TNCV_309101 [Trichonephila clavipes]
MPDIELNGFLKEKKKVGADCYCSFHALNKETQRKGPSFANEVGIILHHDKARPHVSRKSAQKNGGVGLGNFYFYQNILLWLATLTAMPLGLGSNPGEDMDVCKCILPLRHGCTLNNRRAARPLVWLVEEERGGRPLTTPRVFSL